MTNVGRAEVADRLYVAVGTAILVLTATDWLVRTGKEEEGWSDRVLTLWEMFGVVNDDYLLLALLAVAVIVGYALLCTVGQLIRPPSEGVGAVVVSGWLATAASGLIMVFTDAGFVPGTGAWLAFVLCALSAIGSSIHWGALGLLFFSKKELEHRRRLDEAQRGTR